LLNVTLFKITGVCSRRNAGNQSEIGFGLAARYQLVGEVMAHQGDDAVPDKEFRGQYQSQLTGDTP